LPTPAPPQPTTVVGPVSSIVGECPAVTFLINGLTILASSATDFQKGSCKAIKVGTDVTVQGTPNAAGIVIATVIARK
jgi:hypothetical protein